jgi:hypothetical protein
MSGGGGTRARKRVGLSGVMTMKMMRSTSRMSMNGVTLMFGWAVSAARASLLLMFSPRQC